MTWAAALALLRRFWPALPILALSLWAGRLDRLRGAHLTALNAERAARQLDAVNAKVASTQAELRWSKAGTTAATTYADRLAAREPIILRSTDTVREYAQTPAGRAVCRDADRVRSIDLLDTDLARDPAPAGGSTGTVHGDTAAPAAGR